MTRSIDKSDGRTLELGLICPYSLGDAAHFSRLDAGLADEVEKGSLAVVDVA
jgi:hypothetical protein